MSMISPMKAAKQLGSAHEGASHWWAQRVTAVALIGLVVWFVCVLATLPVLDYFYVIDLLKVPHNSILLILLIGSLFYHGYLGMQVVIEDYVHSHCIKVGLLIGFKLASVVAVVASVFTIISIYLAG